MALLERTLPFFIFVIILLLFASFASADRRDLNDRRLLLNYIDRTLIAIEKSLLYIDRHITKLNLDGLIGVRETESRLSVLVGTLWPSLPTNVTKKIRQVVYLANKVADTSEEIIKTETPKYYKTSSFIVKRHFWDLLFPNQHINASLIRTVSEKNVQHYTEKESDDCLNELFGTDGHTRCKISRTCWKRMNGKNYMDYDLTHQIFYIINGIQVNCQTELEAAARKYEGKSVVQLMDFYCANIYMEALTLDKTGFPVESADLFLEQIGLCAGAGYMEIAKWRWLPHVLSLQRPNGCFGILPNERMNPRNFSPNGYGKSKRSTWRHEDIRLRKRVEQAMSDDGCLSHRIGVALSALVAYTRRILQELT